MPGIVSSNGKWLIIALIIALTKNIIKIFTIYRWVPIFCMKFSNVQTNSSVSLESSILLKMI